MCFRNKIMYTYRQTTEYFIFRSQVQHKLQWVTSVFFFSAMIRQKKCIYEWSLLEAKIRPQYAFWQYCSRTVFLTKREYEKKNKSVKRSIFWAHSRISHERTSITVKQYIYITIIIITIIHFELSCHTAKNISRLEKPLGLVYACRQ